MNEEKNNICKRNSINQIILYVLFVIIIIFNIISFTLIYTKKENMDVKLSANEIFKNSTNSVVELKTITDGYGENYGSAVFIDEDGLLLTAAHVVTYKQAKELKTYKEYFIRFTNETNYRKVELLKYDINKDLACLKLKITDGVQFKPIKKKKTKIKYGDVAYAVGNGLNQGISITKGIVSLPSVNIKYNELKRNMIQLNLIVNEGNSGGAIIDDKGNLMGIVSFRIRDNHGNVVYGVGYAIPIPTINDFIEN